MSVISPGRNLVLSGMMGSGKSRVGRIMSELVDRPFVDTDHLIEQTDGRTIAAIFEQDGERVFRDLERAAVRQVSATRGQVIALGGGVVMDAGNVTLLRGTGDIVWIDPPISALASRLASSRKPGKRPLLDGEKDLGRLTEMLTQLRKDRHSAYASSADYVLDTMGRPSEAIAQEVYAWACHHPGLLTPEECG